MICLMMIGSQACHQVPTGAALISGTHEAECLPGYGYSISSSNSEQIVCTACLQGSVCVGGKQPSKVCDITDAPLGKYCPGLTAASVDCPIGYICKGANSDKIECNLLVGSEAYTPADSFDSQGILDS